MSMADEALGEPQPRQLIVSVYGLYARDADGWLPVAGLVRLLAELGVGPQAVRSSISRLKRRDTLRSLRRGDAAGYALAPSMAEILREGDRRIFGHLPATPADGWVQVVFTVPETAAGQAARAAQPAGRARVRADGARASGSRPGTLADEVAGGARPAGPDRLRRPLPRRRTWRRTTSATRAWPIACGQWWDLAAASRPGTPPSSPPAPGAGAAVARRAAVRRRGLRRLRPDAHRLAAAALPRPGAAARPAAGAAGTAWPRRSCSRS